MYALTYSEANNCAAIAAHVRISKTNRKCRRWKMLTPTELLVFRDLLEHQLAELERKAGSTVSDLLGQSIGAADLLDLTTMDSDRSFTLRIRERESKLIRKIKAALRRIQEGSFGECEECGEDISPARLQARPVTTYCIRCKTKLECLEKLGRSKPAA
jgi:DnaK suppressor protein